MKEIEGIKYLDIPSTTLKEAIDHIRSVPLVTDALVYLWEEVLCPLMGKDFQSFNDTDNQLDPKKVKLSPEQQEQICQAFIDNPASNGGIMYMNYGPSSGTPDRKTSGIPGN